MFAGVWLKVWETNMVTRLWGIRWRWRWRCASLEATPRCFSHWLLLAPWEHCGARSRFGTTTSRAFPWCNFYPQPWPGRREFLFFLNGGVSLRFLPSSLLLFVFSFCDFFSGFLSRGSVWKSHDVDFWELLEGLVVVRKLGFMCSCADFMEFLWNFVMFYGFWGAFGVDCALGE